eukprot:3415704-Amphidinium_carterae.1
MKQEVLIGRKDPRSRALTSQELIEICEVMPTTRLPIGNWGGYATKVDTLEHVSMKSDLVLLRVFAVTTQSSFSTY